MGGGNTLNKGYRAFYDKFMIILRLDSFVEWVATISNPTVLHDISVGLKQHQPNLHITSDLFSLVTIDF
jgi:hypothetical protein